MEQHPFLLNQTFNVHSSLSAQVAFEALTIAKAGLTTDLF